MDSDGELTGSGNFQTTAVSPVPIIPQPFDSKYALSEEGNFKLVAYDLMTTGPSLTDDLCSIVAYSPADDKSFAQHIMPYNNLSLGAARRYSLRIVTVGRYRVLKDIRNNKVLETKRDYVALQDFIEFLRSVKGDSEGLILLAHDSRKFFSSLLMDVLTRFRMRDEFCQLVKGFANSYAIAEEKCAKLGRSLSLRSLATALLPKEEGDEPIDLADRAKTTFKLMAKVFEDEQVENGSGDLKMSPELLSQALRSFSCNLDGVERVTTEIQNFRRREESLLPVFTKMRSSNQGERQRSFVLQRLLAQSNIDYEILSDIYAKGGMEALQEVLKCTMDKEHAREIDELRHVFALHFDPEYKGQFKPEPLPGAAQPERPPSAKGRRFYRRRNSGRKGSGKRSPAKSASGGAGSDDATPPTPVAISVTDVGGSTTTAVAAI